MSFSTFLNLVEIKTKLASFFPFVIGVLFSISYFGQIHWINTLIFFCGMLTFDMATTAINNYMDFKKAKSDVYKYEENIIGQLDLSLGLVRWLIFAMIGFTLVTGLYLTTQAGWLFMLIGGMCCFIGIFYTYGPIPLSRMPLGELFSGFTMGLGIFLLVLCVNVIQNPPFYLQVNFRTGLFHLDGNIWSIAAIILAALPLVASIANVMLANNLRDLDLDIKNHRYTLIYYINRPVGIKLFKALALLGYLTIIIGLISGIYHWPVLITFVSLPLVWKNNQDFQSALPHPRSFGYAIKNLVSFNACYGLGLLLSILIYR
ncbi:MAG: 1,4-dihydroxy-2-naphthoate polyprenyltransferase [Lactococcus sp.]|jgi:1,4-dihydroxy-2-naphthoate octaprenyltransferase|nr:1,4-dihydroxy-2-naphthoate polyprenyltransferase [Lactococcus sp.]